MLAKNCSLPIRIVLAVLVATSARSPALAVSCHAHAHAHDNMFEAGENIDTAVHDDGGIVSAHCDASATVPGAHAHAWGGATWGLFSVYKSHGGHGWFQDNNAPRHWWWHVRTSTGTFVVRGPATGATQLRVRIRQSGTVIDPEAPTGEQVPIGPTPSQGMFADYFIEVFEQINVAVTQNQQTTTLFQGTAALGGPMSTAPGLQATGDLAGRLSLTTSPSRNSVAVPTDVLSTTVVTVNTNQAIDLDFEIFLALGAPTETPLEQPANPCTGCPENYGGAGDFVVELELVDQSGAYTLDPNPPCGTNADCDDGLFCNGQEYCDTTLTCRAGQPPNCDDGAPCTSDGCDQLADICVSTPIPNCCTSDAECDDGLFCTGQEFCDPNLTCQAGQPPDCDDGNPCTADSCDDELDECINVPIPDCCMTSADCDDQNECTQDACTPPNQCQNIPTPGVLCGDPANTTCTDPDTCDTTGACRPNNAQDGTPCDDRDLCTANDVCLAGVCAGIADGLCASCVQDGPPSDPVNQLSFQALLKDSTGNLVQGPVDLAFQFYGSMGQPVSNPITLSNVPVSNGIVSTAIPIQDGVFDGTGRTLGVSVNGTPELSPRIPLTSAPQSFRVNCAAGEELVDHLDLGGPQTSGMLRIFGPPIPDSGSVAAAGPAAIAAQVNRAVDAFAPPCGGSYVLSTFTPHETVELYACSHGGGGSALLSNHLGQRTIALVADGDYEAGEINLYNSREEPKKTIYLSAGSGQYDYDGSMIILSKATGERTIVLNGEGRDASLSEGGFGTLSGGGFLVLGAPTRENVAIDNNEIMARNNWGTAPLYLNYEGGNIIMIRSGTGNVGIGTSSPGQKLTVNGTIESTSGGIKFPDGTVQATATLRGERGSRGADGADGADGAPGPAVTTFVVCENGVEAGTTCVNLCGGSEKVEGGAAGECSVSSDTGPCSALSGGLCCVCSP